jgi:hypothetical protein
LLRGCAYLELHLDGEWLGTFWAESEPKLRVATGPQLAHIGWALLTKLQLNPPRSWTRAYLSALERRVWFGAGLQRRHALRAAEALVDLEVPDLVAWCREMDVPVPERARQPRMPLFDTGSYSDAAGGDATEQQQAWGEQGEGISSDNNAAGTTSAGTVDQPQAASTPDSNGSTPPQTPAGVQAGTGSNSTGAGGSSWGGSREQGRSYSTAYGRPRVPAPRGRSLSTRFPQQQPTPGRPQSGPGAGPAPQGRWPVGRVGRSSSSGARQRLWPTAGPTRSPSPGSNNSSSSDDDAQMVQNGAYELLARGYTNGRSGTPGPVNGTAAAAAAAGAVPAGASTGQPWAVSVPDVVRASDSVWDLAGMVSPGRAGDYGAASW